METPNKLDSSDNLQPVKKVWITPTIEIISVESGTNVNGQEGSYARYVPTAS